MLSPDLMRLTGVFCISVKFYGNDRADLRVDDNRRARDTRWGEIACD